MPRPRVLEMGRVITIYLDNWICEQLREEALKKGESISALIREIVIEHLGKSKKPGDQPDQPAGEDPPSVDPVVMLDIEELEEEVSKIEAMLTGIDDAISKAKSKYADVFDAWLDSNRQKILAKLTGAENALKKLRPKYYALKREARNYDGIEKLAARMYTIKRRIKEIRGKLSGKA